MNNYLTAGLNGNSGNLSAVVNDDGSGWVALLGSRDPKMFTSLGGVAANSGAASPTATSLCRSTVISPSADVANTTTYVYDSPNFDFVGQMERVNSAGAQGYLAAYSRSAQKWGIWRLDGTAIPTFAQPFVSSATVTAYSSGNAPSVVYTVTGTNPVHHKLVVNGVTLIDFDETGADRVTAAGYPGLYFASPFSEGQGMFINSMSGDTVVVADTTAPTLTSPTAVATSTTTATATVSTDEGAGTLYCLISTNSTETAASIRASGQSQAVTSTGVKTFNRTGLTANKANYYAHFVQDDAASTPNTSTVSNSASFATPAAGDTTAPTLSSPIGAKTGSTTASGAVTTNEATGVLRWLTSTNASETQAAVLASSLSQAVMASGVQNITRTGLTPGATMRHHFVHTDASGNSSAVASSAAFTLDAAPVRTWTSAMTMVDANHQARPGVAVTAYINAADGTLLTVKTGLVTSSDGKVPAFTTTVGALSTDYRITWVEDAHPTTVIAVEPLRAT